MAETNTPSQGGMGWEKLLNRINLLFTVIAAGTALFISIRFTTQLKALEVQKGEIANKIAEKGFENDFKFRILEKVTDAIRDKDTVQLSFTIQYTQTMLADDTIKNILLSLMAKNIPKGLITDSVRNQIKTEVDYSKQQAFIQQEKQIVADAPNVSNSLRVDIFYVENSNQILNYQKAKTLKAALDDKYEVRVRLLPASVNARPGYNVTANEIRFEQSEKGDADQLKQAIAASGNGGFRDHISSMSTPDYVSVFIAQ